MERLQARDADGPGDGRLGAGDDRAVEFTEPSLDGLDHHVLDAKLDRRMCGVDGPRPARQQLLSSALDYRHLLVSFSVGLARAKAALAGRTPAERPGEMSNA